MWEYCENNCDREILSNVIIRTIEMDNLINEIVTTGFGISPDYGISEPYEHFTDEEECVFLNESEINCFEDLVLPQLGSSTKLKIIKNVGEKVDVPSEEEVLPKIKDLDGKFRRFYQIRNIFAHRITPLRRDWEEENKDKIRWKKLHDEHEKLHKELIKYFEENYYESY